MTISAALSVLFLFVFLVESSSVLRLRDCADPYGLSHALTVHKPSKCKGWLLEGDICPVWISEFGTGPAPGFDLDRLWDHGSSGFGTGKDVQAFCSPGFKTTVEGLVQELRGDSGPDGGGLRLLALECRPPGCSSGCCGNQGDFPGCIIT